MNAVLMVSGRVLKHTYFFSKVFMTVMVTFFHLPSLTSEKQIYSTQKATIMKTLSKLLTFTVLVMTFSNAYAQKENSGYKNKYNVQRNEYDNISEESGKKNRQDIQENLDADILYDMGKAFASFDEYEDAVECFRSSAEQSNAKAQYELGVCYYEGNGVTQSYDEAAMWFTKSAEQGYSLGQYNLGTCYFYGNGVLQNYEEAVKWFRKSSEQDCEFGLYALGMCYEYGFGVDVDLNKAVKYYNKAANLGSQEAVDALNALDCYPA